jgi:hypothetical protein
MSRCHIRRGEGYRLPLSQSDLVFPPWFPYWTRHAPPFEILSRNKGEFSFACQSNKIIILGIVDPKLLESESQSRSDPRNNIILTLASYFKFVLIHFITLFLKGSSHENLICFYWCRWIDTNFLRLFYCIRFKKYHHYHAEFFIIRCSAVGFYYVMHNNVNELCYVAQFVNSVIT